LTPNADSKWAMLIGYKSEGPLADAEEAEVLGRQRAGRASARAPNKRCDCMTVEE